MLAVEFVGGESARCPSATAVRSVYPEKLVGKTVSHELYSVLPDLL